MCLFSFTMHRCSGVVCILHNCSFKTEKTDHLCRPWCDCERLSAGETLARRLRKEGGAKWLVGSIYDVKSLTPITAMFPAPDHRSIGRRLYYTTWAQIGNWVVYLGSADTVGFDTSGYFEPIICNVIFSGIGREIAL